MKLKLALAAFLVAAATALAQQSQLGTGGSGGSGSATNITFTRTIWVSTSGNDSTAAVDSSARPFATVQAAFSNVVSSTKVIILPGTYTVPTKFGGSTGLNYPLQRDLPSKFQDVTNVVVEGWGWPTLQGNQQGAIIGFSNVAHLTVSGLLIAGVKTNGILSNHSNNLGHLVFYGSNNYVTVRECSLIDSEGFAIYGGDNGTSWRTDNMRIVNCTGIRNGHTNFQGGFSATNIAEGGFAQICGNNGLIEGCTVINPSRGVEWFGSGGSDSFVNLKVVTTDWIGCYTKTIFADAGGIYNGLTVEACYFQDVDAHNAGPVAFGEARINCTRVKNLIFRGNTYRDCKVNMLTIGNGSGADTEGANIAFNNFDTIYRGIDLMNDSGAVSTNASVIGNNFKFCTNYAVRVGGADHVVSRNSFVSCGSAANNGAVWVRGSGVTAIRCEVSLNVFSDDGAAWTTYPIRLEDYSVISPYIWGNRALAYQGHPIFDGGSTSPTINQVTTNGLASIGRGTNAPAVALDVGGQIATRGFSIPPNLVGSSVNVSNSLHTITTNAAVTFTFDGTVQPGTILVLQVSNSHTASLTHTIPSSYNPAAQAATTTWAIGASNRATRVFLRTTNTTGAIWEILVDAGMEYSLGSDLGLALRTNGYTVTIAATNQTATIASNATSATVDFTTTRRVLIHSFGNTNLVLSPTNLVDNAQITIEGQGTPNNFDITITNTAATAVRWPLGVSTNGSTSFTVTNAQRFGLVLTVVSNQITVDGISRYR